MNTGSTYRINAPYVIHEIFEDNEAAIINLKSGAYYSLNPVGASIFALLEQHQSLGEIVERLMQRYDGSLARVIDDVNTLVSRLQAEDLIRLAEDGIKPVSVASEPASASKSPYEPPVLERFEDMKELLLLDPIHEVGDVGWPHAVSDKS